MRTDYYLDGSLELILTVLCPPLGLISALIGFKTDPKNWRRHILCIAWGMAAFAYCYQPAPHSNTDLVRYFAYIERMGRLRLAEIWGNGVHGQDDLYVFEFLCWLTGKIGDKHLVPAMSVFCIYYIGMYVTCMIGCSERYSWQNIAKYVFFILLALSFHNIINNVRNIWAFSLVGFAVFRECYEKKRGFLTGALYVIPCFIHQSAVVFLAVRLMMGLVGRAKIISIFAVLIVPSALEFLHGILAGVRSGNVLVNTLIKAVGMGNRYFHDETSSWAVTVKNSGSRKLAKVAYLAIALVMLYYFILLYGKQLEGMLKGSKSRQRSMENFAFFTLLLTLACIPMTQPQYWRFVSILILFGGCVYLRLGDSKDPRIAKKLDYVFFPLVGTCTFWIRELFLNTNIAGMFIRSLICNPFVLLAFKALGISFEMIG